MDIRGVARGDRNENVFARANGLRENAETAISCVRDLDLSERRKGYTSSLEGEEVDAQVSPCGNAIESTTHIVGECKIFKEERDVLERGDEGNRRM